MFESVIPNILSALPALGTALLISLVSAWITVRLALKRFHAEKWWEKKVHAYERLIEALHNLKYDADTSFNALIEKREIPEEKEQLLRAASLAALSEVERAVNIGSFVLSDNCQERLMKFMKEKDLANNADDYFSHLDEYCAATSSCLRDVIDIARRDIGKP